MLYRSIDQKLIIFRNLRTKSNKKIYSVPYSTNEYEKLTINFRPTAITTSNTVSNVETPREALKRQISYDTHSPNFNASKSISKNKLIKVVSAASTSVIPQRQYKNISSPLPLQEPSPVSIPPIEILEPVEDRKRKNKITKQSSFSKRLSYRRNKEPKPISESQTQPKSRSEQNFDLTRIDYDLVAPEFDQDLEENFNQDLIEINRKSNSITCSRPTFNMSQPFQHRRSNSTKERSSAATIKDTLSTTLSNTSSIHSSRSSTLNLTKSKAQNALESAEQVLNEIQNSNERLQMTNNSSFTRSERSSFTKRLGKKSSNNIKRIITRTTSAQPISNLTNLPSPSNGSSRTFSQITPKKVTSFEKSSLEKTQSHNLPNKNKIQHDPEGKIDHHIVRFRWYFPLVSLILWPFTIFLTHLINIFFCSNYS